MSSGKFGGEWGQTPEMVAAELGRAFPGYEVTVRWDRGRSVPRFQVRSRDGASYSPTGGAPSTRSPRSQR